MVVLENLKAGCFYKCYHINVGKATVKDWENPPQSLEVFWHLDYIPNVFDYWYILYMKKGGLFPFYKIVLTILSPLLCE